MSYQTDVIGNPVTSGDKNTEGRAFVATTRSINLGSIDSNNSIDPTLALDINTTSTLNQYNDRFVEPSGVSNAGI